MSQRFIRIAPIFLIVLIAFLNADAASTSRGKGRLGPPPLEPVPRQPSEADPLLPKAWHLTRIGANKAWRITKGSPDVTVAVVDSGIDYNHPDLAPNLRRKASEWPPNGHDDDENGFIDDVIGWDFVHGHPAPWDPNGHGTFVSGIVAAAEGNGIGSAGVCPSCTILPARFLNYEGMGWDEDGLDALRYVVREKVSVINLSFAGEGYDRDYHDVLKEAAQHDIVVVAAAGNDMENIDHESVYPPKFRNLPNMIVVAAVDKYDHLTKDESSGKGSNWSKNWVHIAAPGEEILAPWNDGTWSMESGTSYAAPIVAGAAGLLRSANPSLTAPQVVEILMATARRVAQLEDKLVSGGVINIDAALRCGKARGLPCLHQ